MAERPITQRVVRAGGLTQHVVTVRGPGPDGQPATLQAAYPTHQAATDARPTLWAELAAGAWLGPATAVQSGRRVAA